MKTTLRGILLAAASVLAASCASSAGEPMVRDWMQDLPVRYDPDRHQPIVDAIQLWRLGADYIPPAEDREDGGPSEEADREPDLLPEVIPAEHSLPDLGTGIRWAVAHGTFLAPAVQFSCAVAVPGEEENDATGALGADRPPETRLLGLVFLVKVRAPASVEKQWDTLGDLEGLRGQHPGAGWLLDRIRDEFGHEAIAALLARVPPEDRYHDDAPLAWAAMAAGVTGDVEAIPRLTSLSRGENLNASLSAGRALEMIPGEAAERALAECVRGRRYDAWMRAAEALRVRNPRLLAETLAEATLRDNHPRMVGCLLGRMGDAACVPILCEALRGPILDGARNDDSISEMFDLVEKLATEAQWPLVEALPGAVDPPQVPRAKEVAAAVRARLSRTEK